MGRNSSGVLSTRIEEVIAIGFLADLPIATRVELLKRAQMLDLPAGFFVMRGPADFGGIVVSGLLRLFAADDGEGREVTYRNVGAGETVGLAALLGMRDDVWVQAMMPSSILAFDLRTARSIARRDAAVSSALARETMRRLRDTSRELLIWVRGSVRQRVIRELLDLASSVPSATPLAVGSAMRPLRMRSGPAGRSSRGLLATSPSVASSGSDAAASRFSTPMPCAAN